MAEVLRISPNKKIGLCNAPCTTTDIKVCIWEGAQKKFPTGFLKPLVLAFLNETLRNSAKKKIFTPGFFESSLRGLTHSFAEFGVWSSGIANGATREARSTRHPNPAPKIRSSNFPNATPSPHWMPCAAQERHLAGPRLPDLQIPTGPLARFFEK